MLGLSAAGTREPVLQGSGAKWREDAEENHGELLAGCWGLTAKVRVGLCDAMVLTLYLSLLSASKPEKPWLRVCSAHR